MPLRTYHLVFALLFALFLPRSHGQTSAPARKIWDHILTGKLGPALQACQEWAEADGKTAGAHALLGEVHFRMGRIEEAIEAFKRALDIDQTDLAARVGLPRAYLASGRVEDALRQVKMALAKNPRSPQTYRDVRRIVTRLVKSHGASGLMAFCRTWLESNPEDGRPHCVMGYAYESMGLLEEALEAYS